MPVAALEPRWQVDVDRPLGAATKVGVGQGDGGGGTFQPGGRLHRRPGAVRPHLGQLGQPGVVVGWGHRPGQPGWWPRDRHLGSGPGLRAHGRLTRGGQEVGAGLPGGLEPPVQGDDEVIAGSGGRDVEQPASFPVAHLLVDRGRGREVTGVTPLRSDTSYPPPHPAYPAGCGGHAAEHGDGELQPLGGVHRHDPHRAGIGLRQRGLHHTGGLCTLLGSPRQVGAQPTVLGLRPRPSLIQHEPHPAPLVAGVIVGRGHLQYATVGDDHGEQLTGRPPPRRPMQLFQVAQGLGDGVFGPRLVGRGEEVQHAPVALPRPQVIVAVRLGQ